MAESPLYQKDELRRYKSIAGDISHEYQSFHCRVTDFYHGGNTHSFSMGLTKALRIWGWASKTVRYKN